MKLEDSPYQGKKVLIIGMGLSGRSAACFLIQHGAFVEGIDRNEALLQSHPEITSLRQAGLITHLEEESLNIKQFDCVVISPGIPPSHPMYLAAIQANLEIIGEIELGCRIVQNPIIGVTGTNGKTTVTLLVNHVLNFSGRKAQALGNVGKPFTKELLSISPTDIIVLELSSYQLETLYQPVLDTAVILNITPDHLDWYPSMAEYATAKFYIERCLKPGKTLYLEERAFQKYGYLSKAQSLNLYGYSSNCFMFTDQHALFIENKREWILPDHYQGQVSHEVENLMAAYVLCREFGVTAQVFREALKSFKKPAHRIEFVLEREGITYYDDSKGTNIDAVMRAVQSLKGPIILIAGGVDKGAPYTPWLEVFTNKVKYICAIGQAADKIQRELSHQISVRICKDLDQAVKNASEVAQKGDSILLSPGCSSWDMFRDYAHRGEEFQKIVRNL